jgi:hypothetical protein
MWPAVASAALPGSPRRGHRRSRITAFTPAADVNMRINGGYCPQADIFDYLHEGEDLSARVRQRGACSPFSTTASGRLYGYAQGVNMVEDLTVPDEAHGRSGRRNHLSAGDGLMRSTSLTLTEGASDRAPVPVRPPTDPLPWRTPGRRRDRLWRNSAHSGRVERHPFARRCGNRFRDTA